MVASILQQRKKALELHHKKRGGVVAATTSTASNKVDDVLNSFSLTSITSCDSLGTQGSDNAVMSSASLPDLTTSPICITLKGKVATSTSTSSSSSASLDSRQDHSATHFFEHPALMAKSCQRSIHPANNRSLTPSPTPLRQMARGSTILPLDYFVDTKAEQSEQVSKQRYKLAASNAKKRLKAKHKKPALPIPLPPSSKTEPSKEVISSWKPRTLAKAQTLASSGGFKSRRIAVKKSQGGNGGTVLLDCMPSSMSNNDTQGPTTTTNGGVVGNATGSIVEDFASHCSFSPSGISDLSVSSDEQDDSNNPLAHNRSRPRLPTTSQNRIATRSPTNNTTSSSFTPISTVSRDGSISPIPPPTSDASVNSKVSRVIPLMLSVLLCLEGI